MFGLRYSTAAEEYSSKRDLLAHGGKGSDHDSDSKTMSMVEIRESQGLTTAEFDSDDDDIIPYSESNANDSATRVSF